MEVWECFVFICTTNGRDTEAVSGCLTEATKINKMLKSRLYATTFMGLRGFVGDCEGGVYLNQRVKN